MTSPDRQRGAISLLAVFVITVTAAVLSAAAFTYHLGRATTVIGDYSRAPAEAATDAPDWDKVEKGHLRYAQKAMAHAALAAKSAVEFAGSPSSGIDAGYNTVSTGQAIHEAAAPGSSTAADGADSAAPGDTASPDTGPADSGKADTAPVPESEQPRTDDSDQATESDRDSPDGTYFVWPAGKAAMLVRAGDLEWDPSSNYVTIDTSGGSELTVDGLITNGADVATGTAYSTEYLLWSTEMPWWDDETGLWQVAVMVSRDGTSPELFTATIGRTGTFSLIYDVGAVPVELTAVRDG